MSESREHFGIVGGGLLGLTLALRLAQRGRRVTVLEATDHVGGLADAWQVGDITWDRHYHVTLLSDQHLRGILKELDLDEHMRWVKTRTGFLVDGRLHSFSNVWDFLRFPPLGLIDKVRLAWTIWHASRINDWKALEQQSVGDWLLRHSGRRTFERIWLPLLKAKLGDAWQRTSAAFIWATIQRMYAARRGGQKHELFGYLPGGYARILTAFREKLTSLGVEIQTGCRVKRIASESTNGIDVTMADGSVASFDRVVVTTPGPITAQICPQLTGFECDRLRSVEYIGILCASLVLKKPLAGNYVTNITDAAPFTGVIEMTALVDPAQFGGKSLVYLPKYVGPGDEAWQLSDDQIETQFVNALERLFPNFNREDALAFRLSRVRHVFALSTLGYSQHVPPTETSVPGLFLVNSAQIVNGTLNVNETVRLAELASETLCRPLALQTNPDPADHHTGRSLQVFPYQPQEYVADDCELVARPTMIASLSLDLDNKWSYLKTHGDRGWEEYPSYLDGVVPRFLELLSKLNLRITVFVVGQDAALAKNRAALASIAAAGHEIGNHSFHHEPWLHLYSPEEIENEILSAEEAIADATGVVPSGFRGPGYSLSPAVVQCLIRRGYRYDASTLPTVIGPLARAYYFLHARLSTSQKHERQRLFGNWSDGLKPLRPFWWQTEKSRGAVGGQRLLEIPVTTLPVLRVPIHFSYLLFLRQKSTLAAWAYWRLAMGICQACGIEPSLLLHPLDLLGGEEEGELGFFPGMKLPSAVKTEFVGQLLADFARRYQVVTVGEHAERISARGNLRVCPLRGAARRLPVEEVKRLAIIPDTSLSVEARSQ